MTRRPWLGAVLSTRLKLLVGCGFGLCWALPATAQDSSEQAHSSEQARSWLDWDAPQGCPERAAVYTRAREAAGFAPEQGRFERVRGVIVPAGKGFLLTLQFFEAGGQRSRSLETLDCADLEGAAAVAIALALGSPASDEMASPAPASVEQDVAPAASAQHEAGPPLGWSWAISGLLDLQSVAQASWGVGASTRVRIGALELGLSGSWLPDSQRSVRPGEEVQFGLRALGPLACWRWSAPLAPAACAGVELGQLRADGSALTQNPQRFSSWWLAPGLALEIEQALARGWGVQLRVEALRPLLRERFTINDTESVYESPEAVLRLSLGLGWTLD